MPNHITPEQKRQAAQRRNLAQRRDLAAEAEAEQATAPEHHTPQPVRVAPDDYRRAAQSGQYGGPVARPTFVAYGLDPILVEYEGRDWMITPAALDDWDDVEDAAAGKAPTNEAADIIETIKALFDNEQARYDELKAHLKSVYGYVPGQLMLGFVAEARKAAESQGN